MTNHWERLLDGFLISAALVFTVGAVVIASRSLPAIVELVKWGGVALAVCASWYVLGTLHEVVMGDNI